MYKVTVLEGVTFQPKLEIFVENFPWERKWNGGHQGSFSFKGSEIDLRPELHRTNIWPLENWLVVEWNNTPVYAAIITDHQYKRSTQTITISYADIWFFWDRRFVLDDRSADAGGFVLDWKKISYRTLAIRAVKRGLIGDGPLWWDLPIIFAPETAGTLDREVWGYSFESVQALLSEAMEGGDLNIDFRPRWAAAGNLEFVMEINGSGTLLEYDLDAHHSPVLDLDYKVDGTLLANHVYGTGEGSEVDMVVRNSSKPSASTYPALERVISGKQVTSKPRLQALVSAERINYDQMLRQTTLKVRPEGPPSVDKFRLGATVRWRTVNDPYLPNTWHQQTVIQISGSLKPEVNLVLSEFWSGM